MLTRFHSNIWTCVFYSSKYLTVLDSSFLMYFKKVVWRIFGRTHLSKTFSRQHSRVHYNCVFSALPLPVTFDFLEGTIIPCNRRLKNMAEILKPTLPKRFSEHRPELHAPANTKNFKSPWDERKWKKKKIN